MKVSLLFVDTRRAVDRGKEEVLAYTYHDRSDWFDPYGGFFDEEESADLQECAEGRATSVRLSRRTKHERVVSVRVAVEFDDRDVARKAG